MGVRDEVAALRRLGASARSRWPAPESRVEAAPYHAGPTPERPPVRRAPYVVPMALMTLSYLVFELGFNARLLDVTGGYASEHEVAQIEKWGRIISGVAVTLGVWGTWLLPKADKRCWGLGRTLAKLALAAAVCMSLVYWAEKALIDGIVDGSGGASRRVAAQLRVVSGAVLNGAVSIDGLDISPGQLSQPEGKSFLAVFPFLAFSTEDLGAKSDRVLKDVLRSNAETIAGTAGEAYNKAFIPSVVALKDSYNQYAEGAKTRNAVIADTKRQQEKAWREFEVEVHERSHGRATPATLPRPKWEEAGQALRDKGINVPRGWNPADLGPFNQAVAAKVEREATEAFHRETAKALGSTDALPDKPEWKTFIAHPAVQRKWRASLQAPAGVALAPDMGFVAYRDTVYEPTISGRVNADLMTLRSQEAAFADGGAHAALGRAAMQGLVVPPIALAFSIAGALVHLFKSANYLSLIAVPRLPLRRTLILSGVAALALSVFWLPNAVTRSNVFDYFETRTAQAFFQPSALAVRWVVQAQPYFYPLNETIRRTALFGYTFGYEGKGTPGATPL